MYNLRNNFFNILKQKRKYYPLIQFGKIEKILKTTGNENQHLSAVCTVPIQLRK